MHSTDDLDDGYLGSGKRLWNSIKKHGKDNHRLEILEFFDSRKELRDREEQLVNEDMLQDPMCMNLMTGGGGGFISVEQQRQRSIAGGRAFAEKLNTDKEFAKKWNNMLSERMRQRHKDGICRYDNFKGRKHTEETKRKMSEADRTGVKNSQYGTCWIFNDTENKKIKKEQLEDYLSNGWSKGRNMGL